MVLPMTGHNVLAAKKAKIANQIHASAPITTLAIANHLHGFFFSKTMIPSITQIISSGIQISANESTTHKIVHINAAIANQLPVDCV